MCAIDEGERIFSSREPRSDLLASNRLHGGFREPRAVVGKDQVRVRLGLRLGLGLGLSLTVTLTLNLTPNPDPNPNPKQPGRMATATDRPKLQPETTHKEMRPVGLQAIMHTLQDKALQHRL